MRYTAKTVLTNLNTVDASDIGTTLTLTEPLSISAENVAKSRPVSLMPWAFMYADDPSCVTNTSYIPNFVFVPFKFHMLAQAL